MPFTLSHAAVVLPFSRPLARWNVLSAALVGSMVPDSRYFLPWHTQRIDTHGAASLLTYSLPAGLFIYWLFQYLIKVPVIELMPDGAYARWLPYRSPASIRTPRQWLLAGCAVLAGALTHLVWDAFTHEGARGVRMLPVLDETVFDIGRHHMIFARLLQDVSSLLGLMVVIAIIAFGLRPGRVMAFAHRRLSTSDRRAWTIAFVAAVMVLFGAFLILARGPYPFGIASMVYYSAIASLRALATAVIVFAIALQVRLRLSRANPVYRSSEPER